MKKIATYTINGNQVDVEYDPEDPCVICGKPVVEASVGGTAVCSWCDTGYHRDGTKWTYGETVQFLGERR